MGFINYQTNNKDIEICTSTRQDGFSKVPFDSFNMSYNVGDDPKDVLLNREKALKELNILPYNLIIANQKNTDGILEIKKITDGRDCDAMYTKNKELALSIIHSDCSPIFLYCKDKQIIAAIHASIRGSFLEITKRTVKQLIKKENVDPKQILAFIGPGVSFCHILATESYIKKADNLGYLSCVKRIMNVDYLDVTLMNFIQLRSQGVEVENISLPNYDTYDNANLFFSSMRNNVTGKMISVIKFTN